MPSKILSPIPRVNIRELNITPILRCEIDRHPLVVSCDRDILYDSASPRGRIITHVDVDTVPIAGGGRTYVDTNALNLIAGAEVNDNPVSLTYAVRPIGSCVAIHEEGTAVSHVLPTSAVDGAWAHPGTESSGSGGA